MAKGNLDQAIHSLNKALSLEPNNVIAHLNLGNAYLTIGDFDKSIEHNLKCVEIKPGFGMAHNNLAVSFFHTGDLEKARLHAKEAQKCGYTVHPEFIKKLG